MMHGTVCRVVAAMLSVVVAGLIFPGPITGRATGQQTEAPRATHRFQRTPIQGHVQTDRKPLLRRNETVEVVAILAENPVATIQETAGTNAVSTGQLVPVVPNGAVNVPIWIDDAAFVVTPPKGLMVVTPDNKGGKPEADLIRIRRN